MKDRNVQYPMRYVDEKTGQIFMLVAMPGTVTEPGSLYNKANVLPEDVCDGLGITDHTGAEPKDAFGILKDAKNYGKISMLSDGGSAGQGYPVDSAIAEFAKIDFNDFNNIPDTVYDRMMIPKGAKLIKITASATMHYDPYSDKWPIASIYLGGVFYEQLTFFTKYYYSTAPRSFLIKTNGDGTEYVQMHLEGNTSEDYAKRSSIKADYLIMEILKQD